MFEERLRKAIGPDELAEGIWDIEPSQSGDGSLGDSGPTEAKRWGNNKKKIPKAAKKAKRKTAKRSKQINRK